MIEKKTKQKGTNKPKFIYVYEVQPVKLIFFCDFLHYQK